MFINQILTKLKSLVYSKSETDSLLNGKASSSHTHTKSQITDFPSLAIVATSGSYNDLSNKPTIRNDILHYAAVSSLDADTISEDGIWYVAGAINGAPMVHHGAFLNVRAVGTPFQMYFPDDLLYVYKRTYSSGAWSSWEKMNARSWDDIQSKPTIPSKTSQLTNDSGYITSSGSCNYANSAGYASSAGSAGEVNTSVADGSSKDLLYSFMASNDYCRIRCGGVSDAGWLEIATGDNGNDPIYVRQNDDVNGTVRTLTLLDGSGNTQFPGTVTAPTFSGNLNGNCSGTAGGVAWTNVSGRPTAVSQFTNDSGFLTSADRLPIGSYIQFAGSQAPDGFLVCNGGAVSRTTYSKLFAVIGTTYGNGDGSTTFNLPNLTDRFLQGSTTSGTVKNAGLPNIEGFCTPASQKSWRGFNAFGAFEDRSSGDDAVQPTAWFESENYNLYFNASWSNSIYGNSTTVQPPALTCLICIKY